MIVVVFAGYSGKINHDNDSGRLAAPHGSPPSRTKPPGQPYPFHLRAPEWHDLYALMIRAVTASRWRCATLVAIN
jgi:hypothetical protein